MEVTEKYEELVLSDIAWLLLLAKNPYVAII